QALYDDETYTLSIDSHMRFAPHWDQILIEELQRCDSEHAVLSCYPPDYRPEQEQKRSADDQHDAIVMVVGSVLEGGIPRFAGHLLSATPSRPLRGLFAAAGFHFGPGHLIENVPTDPAYYFNQEEAALAVKLWTHGYDIYSPTRQVIFHQYMNLPHGEARRPLHWEDHDNWGAIHKQGVERLLHILNVESASNLDALRDIEHYPLGSQRSLNEFMRLSGIDFSSADKTSRAANGEFIAELNPWFSPDQATAAPSIRTVI
ncbi:MAG: GlcNAc-transferase family protein, partial [Gammaproteobacteria bacterium]